jgi:hypothetical protein
MPPLTRNPSTLFLYDRSLELHETFDSKVIDHLLKEFGVLCERNLKRKSSSFSTFSKTTDSFDYSQMNLLNFKTGEIIYLVLPSKRLTYYTRTF